VAFAALHQQERLQVLRCCTQLMPLQEGVELHAVAAQLRGYVAADVAAVCAEAALMCAVEAVHAAEAAGQEAAVDAPEFLASLQVGPAHFEAAVARLGPAVLRGLAPEIPEISFDQIGGLQVRVCCVARGVMVLLLPRDVFWLWL
jgi:transitional endoplasmic reticulum ATPase